MTETPTDDQPGFLAEESEYCHACYCLIEPGFTYYLISRCSPASTSSPGCRSAIREHREHLLGFNPQAGIDRSDQSARPAILFWVRHQREEFWSRNSILEYPIKVNLRYDCYYRNAITPSGPNSRNKMCCSWTNSSKTYSRLVGQSSPSICCMSRSLFMTKHYCINSFFSSPTIHSIIHA